MSSHMHTCTSGALQARYELVDKLNTLDLSDSVRTAEIHKTKSP